MPPTFCKVYDKPGFASNRFDPLSNCLDALEDAPESGFVTGASLTIDGDFSA